MTFNHQLLPFLLLDTIIIIIQMITANTTTTTITAIINTWTHEHKYTNNSSYKFVVKLIPQLAPLPFLMTLTIWGSWALAKLLISDWLRLASSCRRDSFCCSITLFSSSMDFRLDSIVVIWVKREQLNSGRLQTYLLFAMKVKWELILWGISPVFSVWSCRLQCVDLIHLNLSFLHQAVFHLHAPVLQMKNKIFRKEL